MAKAVSLLLLATGALLLMAGVLVCFRCHRRYSVPGPLTRRSRTRQHDSVELTDRIRPGPSPVYANLTICGYCVKRPASNSA